MSRRNQPEPEEEQPTSEGVGAAFGGDRSILGLDVAKEVSNLIKDLRSGRVSVMVELKLKENPPS